MTEAQEQKLNEVHEMLTIFMNLYKTRFEGKSPNPNDTSLCAKKIE